MSRILLLLALVLTGYCSRSQSIIAPSAYAETLTGAGFNGPLAGTARTYQLLINESELTAMVGRQLTGISFRSSLSLANQTSWPATTATCNKYDIYLSEGVAPANRSLTFASNIVGTQVQVRSGPLVIDPNTWPAGGVSSFGATITFNTPYLYNGGHLLLEIRHEGFGADARTNDAVPSTNPIFGSVVSTAYALSYTATNNAFGVGGAVTTKFIYSTVLPVKLANFSAAPVSSGIQLSWVTAEEQNSAYFEVQKSTDGTSFSPLGRVAANGNAASVSAYSYTDEDAPSSPVFYRLKMVDRDDAYSYSAVVHVRNGTPDQGIVTVAPNPFKDRISISFQHTASDPASVNLYDLSGKCVYSGKAETGRGSTTCDVMTAGWPAGLYFLELKGAVNRTMTLEKR